MFTRGPKSKISVNIKFRKTSVQHIRHALLTEVEKKFVISDYTEVKRRQCLTNRRKYPNYFIRHFQLFVQDDDGK